MPCCSEAAGYAVVLTELHIHGRFLWDVKRGVGVHQLEGELDSHTALTFTLVRTIVIAARLSVT